MLKVLNGKIYCSLQVTLKCTENKVGNRWINKQRERYIIKQIIASIINTILADMLEILQSKILGGHL